MNPGDYSTELSVATHQLRATGALVHDMLHKLLSACSGDSIQDSLGKALDMGRLCGHHTISRMLHGSICPSQWCILDLGKHLCEDFAG